MLLMSIGSEKIAPVISVCFGRFCFSTAQGSSPQKGDIQITQRTNQHNLLFSNPQWKYFFREVARDPALSWRCSIHPKETNSFEQNTAGSNIMIIVWSTKFQIFVQKLCMYFTCSLDVDVYKIFLTFRLTALSILIKGKETDIGISSLELAYIANSCRVTT